jgi:hypothetical protein
VARSVQVKVYGLKEFRLAVLRLDRQLPEVVEDAARDAAELVARSARNGFPVGPARNGHARSTIEATKKGDGWSVQGGGEGWPYYPWLDFGGTINKHTGNPTHRPFFKKGRFIYPAYERNQPAISRIMARALEQHAESSGLDVD